MTIIGNQTPRLQPWLDDNQNRLLDLFNEYQDCINQPIYFKLMFHININGKKCLLHKINGITIRIRLKLQLLYGFSYIFCSYVSETSWINYTNGECVCVNFIDLKWTTREIFVLFCFLSQSVNVCLLTVVSMAEISSKMKLLAQLAFIFAGTWRKIVWRNSCDRRVFGHLNEI